MGGKELEGAPFVVKTYQLVDDPSTDNLVTWSAHKDSFIVLNPVEFAAEVLPKYFKHNNFCSFIRQLNTYGFHKVETNGSKQWEFKQENFVKGNTESLKNIARRKSKKRESSKPQAADSPATKKTTAVVEANESVDEDPVEEVELLRNMNAMLMKEIVSLQKKQQTTQDTVSRILNELIESRKEQAHLQKKVLSLEQELIYEKHPSYDPSTVDDVSQRDLAALLANNDEISLQEFAQLDLTVPEMNGQKQELGYEPQFAIDLADHFQQLNSITHPIPYPSPPISPLHSSSAQSPASPLLYIPSSPARYQDN